MQIHPNVNHIRVSIDNLSVSFLILKAQYVYYGFYAMCIPALIDGTQTLDSREIRYSIFGIETVVLPDRRRREKAVSNIVHADSP